MKGLIYEGERDIRYGDVPEPVLGSARNAIVRTTMTGLCGSDLHTYHGTTLVDGTGFCVGHEAIGIIEEIGSDVSAFEVGDRVMLPASVGCGQCEPCRHLRVIECEGDMLVYGQGFPTIGGCQAELVEVPVADTNLVHLPDEISDDLGVLLTDNLPTAWYAARRGRVTPGDVVVVVGLGPVGQLAVASALAMGASRVLGIDPVAERREAAAAIGAVAAAPEDALSVVAELTTGKGADVAIEAVGASEVTLRSAVELVAKGGRVSMVGVNMRDDLPFPMLQAILRNVEFHVGVCSVQYELPALLRLLRAGRLEVPSIVSHRLPLAQGAEGYRVFDERGEGVGKVVFVP